MFGVFKFVAEIFDERLDSVLGPVMGKDFGRLMGVVGTIVVCALTTAAVAVGVAIKGRDIQQPVYHLVIDGKPSGRLPVLNSPSLSAEKIINWSNRAVRDIFRFNFRDIDQRLAMNSVYFTEASWTDFEASMKKTKMVEKVKAERLFVTLTPMEEPQLIGRSTVVGREVLRLEVPVVITYIGGEKPVYQKQFLELFVLPVPTTEDPEGLAIAKLRAHPYQ